MLQYDKMHSTGGLVVVGQGLGKHKGRVLFGGGATSSIYRGGAGPEQLPCFDGQRSEGWRVWVGDCWRCYCCCLQQ